MSGHFFCNIASAMVDAKQAASPCKETEAFKSNKTVCDEKDVTSAEFENMQQFLILLPTIKRLNYLYTSEATLQDNEIYSQWMADKTQHAMRINEWMK